MAFQKVERSYYSTQNGCRLATFEEASNGLEMIKEQNILNKWDRVRLLDGWITGPGYNFEMGNDFKGCLGYMLLIKTEASGVAYADVHLSNRGKEVALFLCVDDWNFEVVYWLINSWSNSETMNIGDVRGGNISFSNVAKFQNLNKVMGSVARRLDEEVGAALEKARQTEYSGIGSVKEVLSGMIKISEELKDIPLFGGVKSYFTLNVDDEYCLPGSVKEVAEPFWSFVCDSFAGFFVESCSLTSLLDIRKMKTESTNQNNLMTAISILFHLSDFRADIIHEPMAHNCKGSCAKKILLDAAGKAAGNSQKFNEILKNINAMWRSYDDSGNYCVLDKLLVIVAKRKYQGEKIAATVIDILLQCGARPGRLHAIGKYKNKTVLHSVAKFRDEDVGTEVAQALLRRFDEQDKYEFINSADDRGRTALHSASERGNAHICKLLVDCGASVAARDKKGMTALHYALEVGKEVAQALIQRCDERSVCEFVNAADVRGRTALHSASEKGDARICRLLVDYGALLTVQDGKGMTALHYAVDGGFDEVIEILLKNPNVTEALDLKDKHRVFTPLDIALANKDYESTAKLLLKSRDPEAYLDIALPHMDLISIAKLLSKSAKPEAYFNKVDQKQLLRNSLLLGSVDIVDKLFVNGIRLPDGDCDEAGKRALQLAAMCDNESDAIELISLLIRNVKGIDLENMVAECDQRGRTALHEAALNGHTLLCEGLLQLNSELIYLKDIEGRNPLYDAVQGEHKDRILYKQLLKAYMEKNKPEAENDLVDHSGLTPLHVAASQGKTKVVEEFLSSDEIVSKYLSRGDIVGQTALHKAIKHGYIDTVGILLKHDAHPLRERDCDGRTALHYTVQAETEYKQQLIHMLLGQCESEEEESLLLWASAAGLGTADQNLSKNDPLHKFLVEKKKEFQQHNLLKMAASIGDITMTKELISRGYQIGDIRDLKWRTQLPQAKQKRVNRGNILVLSCAFTSQLSFIDDVPRFVAVLKHIEKIKEQGNDKPAISDSLGRLDYAQGLAALFLNPYIKPPIAVGITGSWGMGKSSLMLQTQRILLTAAAEMTLLQYSKSSSSELPDIKRCELSRKGKRILDSIYRQIKCGEQVNRNIFFNLWDYIRSKLQKTSLNEIQKELEKFLKEYDLKNLKVFKALAAMDSRDMLKTNTSWPKADPSAEENVPAVLTVQYNSWKYRNETEALAGIAVEITKELEGIMSLAQWLNTCWRNTWKKKKYALWIEIFFPSLLALILVGSFTWIAWVVFDSNKLREWGKAKYAWPPAALVIIVWILTKSVMGILKPVSTQLMQYISFPDHTDKLGYHDRVISDISFLKDEIGKKAYWVFIVFAWVFTTFKMLWTLITESSITSLLFHHRGHGMAIEAPKVPPASGSNLRIIVFVDDLDRCQESVILQILSAINLVLAVCEISVVVGMDKKLIKRAIIKKYKDINANESFKDKEELADMYLQKIIQLPLDLPDPSDEESRRFLKGQLGVLENEDKTFINDDRSSNSDDGEREAVEQYNAAQVEINMQFESEITETGPIILPQPIDPTVAGRQAPLQTDGDANVTSIEPNPNSSTLIKEMLFVKYSQGEEDAFLCFQRLATNCRKLPREWKRLLNYHRLIWYIFSVSKEAKYLAGWQVQLITWIFVCWEWKENMNLVMEKWRESGKKFLTAESDNPSLLMIVENLMKEFERETSKLTVTSKGEDGLTLTQKMGETGESVVEIINIEETEKLNENGENSIPKVTNGEENVGTGTKTGENMGSTSQKFANEMEYKLDALEKSLDELKREMKEIKELVSDNLKMKKDITELKKQLSNEIKEDIKEVKEQIAKKESGKNVEKWTKKNKELHENWKRMKSTLKKYDVSMDGIQAFQRFRFYCIAGYLPRPSLGG